MHRIQGVFLCSLALTQVLSQAPVELGKVDWLRDLDQGKAIAQKKDKPIFLLFQEVPGCATCQHYGIQVLAHPLIVEAVETYFVPVAVFNNRGGLDAKVLDAYQEPSWNNPVVRFVDHQGINLVSRHAGDYTASGLLRQMMQVMNQEDVEVPGYLSLLAEELKSSKNQLAEATFGMYCFWTGEKTFGQLDGVVHTKAGYIDGKEVVEVRYDPTTITFEELAQKGMKARCADLYYYIDQQQQFAAKRLFDKSQLEKKSKYREDREMHYYLHHSKYAQIPMSPMQRTKANAMLGNGIEPAHIFSPNQLMFLDHKKPQNRYLDAKWMDLLLTNN